MQGTQQSGRYNALLRDAHASFNAGNYDEVFRVLSEVPGAMRSENAGADGEPPPDQIYKVRLNTALAQYAAGNFSQSNALEAALTGIATAMLERSDGGAADGDAAVAGSGGGGVSGGGAGAGARGTGGGGGGGGAAAAKVVAGRNGAAAAAGGSEAGGGDPVPGDGSFEERLGVWGELDAGGSRLLYNMAALRFQQRRTGQALALLEHLFQRIEPLDDVLATHVCFLLLETLCQTYRGALHSEAEATEFARRTAEVLAYLERPHSLNMPLSSGGGDGGSGAAGGGGGGSSAGAGAAGGGAADGGGEVSEADQREFQFRLRLYKSKVLLLQLQPKTAKKEIKAALEIFQRQGGSSATPAAVAAGAGAAPGSTGAFLPIPPPGVQNTAALYLKANFEHLRQNHRKAIKLLASCHGFQGTEEYYGPGEPAAVAYYNNMGCLHHRLRRHHTALAYFRKALLATGPGSGGGSGVEADGRICPAVTCEVLYNAGLQLLLLGRPSEAHRCLEASALLFHGRPRLWLRMAEACIMQHQHSCCCKEQRRGGGLIAATVGSGLHRRVLLPVGPADGSATGATATPAPVPAPLPVENGESRWARAVMGTPPATAAAAAASVAAAAAAAGAAEENPLQRAAKYLHSCLYLCAEQERLRREREVGARGGLGHALLGAGVSPRIVAKGLAARSSSGNGTSAGSGGDGGGGGSSTAASGAASGGGDAADGAGKDPPALDSHDRLKDPTAQAALASLSYVYLALNDPVHALFYARELLTAPLPWPAPGAAALAAAAPAGGTAVASAAAAGAEAANGMGPDSAVGVAPALRLLGRLYAAEALCGLGRMDEALELVSPDGSDDGSGGSSSGGTAVGTAAVTDADAAAALAAALAATPAAPSGTRATEVAAEDAEAPTAAAAAATVAAGARAALPAALAALRLQCGELEEAERALQPALAAAPSHPKVLRLLVYLLLKRGDAKGALRVLHEGRAASGGGSGPTAEG